MWTPEDFDFSSNQSSVFVLSAWHELFYGFTPDSYQPRLHNVASLIQELVDVGARWLRQPLLQSQVQKIQAELKVAIDDEDDCLVDMPSFRSRTARLTDAKTPHSIISAGRILLENETQAVYQGVLEKHAKCAIEGLPKSKQKTLRGIRRLATVAFQQGKEDDDVWVALNKDPSRTPSEIFRELVDLSQGSENQYRCTLTVFGSTKEVNSVARKQGYSIVSSNSLPHEYFGGRVTERSSGIHIQMPVVAKSIRDAVAKARRILGIEMGLVSLYSNPSNLRIHETALVVIEEREHLLIHTEQAFRRLFPRKRARNDIHEALEFIQSNKVDRRIMTH